VGCVALDTHGNLAAGTSTGGRTNKKYGRVGDSPIVGAGTYANNATCAVSGTGLGEQFIRHAVAFNISARMAYLKQPLQEAVAEVIHKTLDADDGGVIALGADGTIFMDFSTAGMARAAADSSGRREVKIGR
jgi:beta-aspartyl-peptidase (threonine type)